MTKEDAKTQILDILNKGGQIWNEGNVFLLGGIQIPNELIEEIKDQLAIYNQTQVNILGIKK